MRKLEFKMRVCNWGRRSRYKGWQIKRHMQADLTQDINTERG
jgi:hypothetical protein